MSMEQGYPEITDWSKEGRAAIVQNHGAVLSEMLRHAMEQIAEPYGLEAFLEAFDFPTLEDAVEWCLQEFVVRKFDPSRMTRSWRLFVQPRFWLAQRCGQQGCRRKLMELETLRRKRAAAPDSPPAQSEEPSESPLQPEAIELQQLRSRLVTTLQKLRSRTCAALVLWWLRATDSLRAGWFDPPVASPPEEALSKKARSMVAHDALFRFQCLHRSLIRDESETDLGHLLVREWLFRPCQEVPPYRRSDEEVEAALPLDAPLRTRALQKLRREEVVALLDQLVTAIHVLPSREEPSALFEWKLLRSSIAKTTLTVFKLDEGAMPELSRRIQNLPELEHDRRTP